MSDFKPIELYSNWGYWDILDGIKFRCEELIEIKWPDDFISQHKIKLKIISYRGNLGLDSDHYSEEAFIEINHHTLYTVIALRNSKLLARRI